MISQMNFQRIILVLACCIITNLQGFKLNSHFIKDLFNDYDKLYRPESLYNASEPLSVGLTIDMEEISQPNPHAMEFTLNLIVREVWFDDRLYFNTSQYPQAIVINSMTDKLWLPKLYFPHSVGKVERMTNTELIWLAPGGEIYYSERITVRISCNLNLRQFPMDTQICPVVIGVYSYSNKDLILNWFHGDNSKKNFKVNQKMELSEFKIMNIETVSKENCIQTFLGEFSCSTVNLTLKRRYQYYLINTFLPTMLIIIISWISFLIDFKSAPARISLGLLSVLALITQYTVTMNNAPRVSYIKALDVWLFTCLAFVIVTLVEFAVVNWLYREGCKPILCYSILPKRKKSSSPKKKNHKESRNQMMDMEGEYVLTVAGLETSSSLHVPHHRKACRCSISKQGYKLDCIFFIIYPVAFSIFTVTYWYVYIHWQGHLA